MPRVFFLGSTVTYNSVITDMASVIAFVVNPTHVIKLFVIRESFIITVGACFW